MRISLRHRFVFLAMPRTGSTTLRNLLDAHSEIRSVHISEIQPDFPFYHHISAAELMGIFAARGWDWNACHRFCVVRNPYDRVVSLYHHQLQMIRARFGNSLTECFKHWRAKKPSFEAYVMRIDPAQRLTTSLRNLVCDPEGVEQVDALLRYEHLETEIAQTFETLGLPLPEGGIPKLNASTKRRNYRTYYNDKTRERVGQLYRHEIERFGYSF